MLRWLAHGQPDVGVELAWMPAKANLGRTAHICDPGDWQNYLPVLMVVILGADRVRQGRVRRPSLGSSCGRDSPLRAPQAYLPRSSANTLQQRRRYCTSRNAAPPAKALIFSAS